MAYRDCCRPWSSRPLALTMPAVTVKANASPSGFPMASAHSPTRVESELPNWTVGRPRVSILMTATSVLGSVPTTLAVNSRLSYSFTVTLSAPATTWLFVRIKPPAEVREEVLEPRRQPLVLGALDVLRPDEHDRRLHVLRDAHERVAQIRRRFERGRRQPRRRRLSGGDRLRRVAPVGKTERGRERQPEHERYRHQRSELQPIPRTYRHRRSFSGRGYFF